MSYLVTIVEEAAAKAEHENTKLRLEGSKMRPESVGLKVLKILLRMHL